MARLFLFDGTALLYRAFFALDQSLQTSYGQPTGVVYGIARMLIKFLKDHVQLEQDYCAVVFDSKGGSTARKELFQEYKANRPEKPEIFIKQIEPAEEVVKALGLKVLKLQGYEADDIIATFAKKYREKFDEINIITADKDLMQLVDDKTFIWRPEKGASEFKKYDEKEVFEKYSVYPNQIMEFLALMGDSSDNIPGVPGIGEKTAASLLQKYGSVEKALEKLSELPEKVKRSLSENYELFELSKKLVELDFNVPLGNLDELLEGFKYSGFNNDELLNVLKKYEFSSLIRELGLNDKNLIKIEYKVVGKDANFKEIYDKINNYKEYILTIVATTPDSFSGEIIGVGVKPDDDIFYYIPLASAQKEKVLEFLTKILSCDCKIICHDAKNILKFLKSKGLKIKQVFFDTKISAYLLNPNEKNYDLDALALKYLGYQKSEVEDLTKGLLPLFANDLSYVSVEDMAKYLCEESEIVHKLYKKFYPGLYSNELLELMDKIEMPLVNVLADIELNGVYFDLNYLKELSHQVEEKLNYLSEKIYEMAGERFNINSSKQLAYILFGKLGIEPVKTTDKGSQSTDYEVLESLASEHKIAEYLMEYRKLQKLKSTYIDAIPTYVNPKTGRVHSNFNQTGTATGRLSSSDPNLQNLPGRTEEGKEIRKAVRAQKDSWWILGADYSQIELRILAHMSEDPELLRAFHEKIDVHSLTATKIFNIAPEFLTDNMRRIGKMVNFAIIYGVSPYGLARRLGLSVSETRKLIDNYFKSYPKVLEFIAKTKELAKKQGYVRTLFGRKRDIPQLHSKDENVKNEGERIAVNTPIQGTAADIIKLAMINIQKRMEGLKSKMILQVHDELVFEVADDELEIVKNIVKEEMENVVKLKVPLEVEIYVGKEME